MAVPAASTSSVRPTGTVFELEALEGMPCGCVAAAYRARPWDVAVVSLEAKGPHCILPGHASGQILRLGDPSEFDEDDDEEESTRKRKRFRYRWPDDLRDDVLARLLVLNEQQYEEEVRAGLHDKADGSRATRRKSGAEEELEDQGELDL